METNYAVEMKNVTKTFGSTVANNNVSLTIKKGEILSLLGENGSGKTTIMNMLAGIYFPDSGQIYINGKEESIRSPKDAYDLGIGMIHQHFKLVDIFSGEEGKNPRIQLHGLLCRVNCPVVQQFNAIADKNARRRVEAGIR